MAAGGVKEVHTNLISTPAHRLLEQNGIRVAAKEEVPQILNRDRSAMCPIDAQIVDIDSVDECVKLLKERLMN